MICKRQLCREYYRTQAGTGLPYFAGRTYQRGHGLSNIFRGLYRSIIPLLKQGAKTLGSEALHTGFKVFGDVMDKKPLRTALRERLREAGTSLQTKAENKLNHLLTGKGIKKRKDGRKRQSRTKRRRVNKDIFAS